MNWLFDNNINTDLITPGRYNITTDPLQLVKVCFIEHRPEFAKKVKKGDFVVAGNNFGCGSSRETAVTALKYSGIKAILAKSFARIFYRNCLNQGVYAIITDTDGIQENDELRIDIKNKSIINKTKKTVTPAVIPDFMIKLHDSDGVIKYLQTNGLNSIATIFE